MFGVQREMHGRKIMRYDVGGGFFGGIAHGSFVAGKVS